MKNSYLIIGVLAFLAVSGIAYASFSENKAKEMMVKAEVEKELTEEMENEKMMKEEEMKKTEEHDKMDGAM